jgi:hypothetical protein
VFLKLGPMVEIFAEYIISLFTSLLARRRMSMLNEFQTMSKSCVAPAEQDG